MVNKEMKMADLVHQNYHILPIINRFGIRLGFGDKMIMQICAEKNIDTDFFVEVVNVFLNDEYFPQENLQRFSVSSILGYLKKSHDFFINVKLDSIEKKINELIEHCCRDNSTKIELIKNFYIEYKNELIEHIKYEDEQIFPYVNKVLKAIDKNEKFESDDFSIEDYLENHTDVEEKLFDLKNLIIKYLQLPKEVEISNEILFELFDLEKDLQNHQNFEEKVLVPVVVKLEQELKSKN
ncbi:MAG: hemerythrin domain-containing protein [Bacteroidales bacterium]|nr:hemerythrin domain-containing protein [Bacteroidales bacterium]